MINPYLHIRLVVFDGYLLSRIYTRKVHLKYTATTTLNKNKTNQHINNQKIVKSIIMIIVTTTTIWKSLTLTA